VNAGSGCVPAGTDDDPSPLAACVGTGRQTAWLSNLLALSLCAALAAAVDGIVSGSRGPHAAWAGEATGSAVVLMNPFQNDPSAASEGKSLFNQYCSHCHAPNAMNPDPAKDLRRLKRRYGDRMTEVFHTTVTDGRPDKGMPVWGGVLDDETLWKIFSFLQTVQTGS
jgi:polar amino acid transport system substrate-binding protein